jgi:hypothetical protein
VGGLSKWHSNLNISTAKPRPNLHLDKQRSTPTTSKRKVYALSSERPVILAPYRGRVRRAVGVGKPYAFANFVFAT